MSNTNTKSAAEIAAKTKKPRILYFEGAGSATEETKAVGNCRIRTAFHAKGGRLVYLEILGGCYPQKAKRGQVLGAVDFAHYITGDSEDCNKSCIPGVYRRGEAWEYTLDNILAIVRKCGGEFDEVRVLPFLSGYFVHRDDRNGYNYADEFEFDEAATAKREEIKAELHRLEYEARKKDREKIGKLFVHTSGGIYPCFSLWPAEDRPDILHYIVHMNCRNYETEININAGTVRECIKAASGWTDETYGDFEKITKEGR